MMARSAVSRCELDEKKPHICHPATRDAIIRLNDERESVSGDSADIHTGASAREAVRVVLDDGIAWVELNRPEKRNAMNPQLNAEMVEVLLEALDADDGCGVLVLTGAGESFSAGMDLKEYFREIDGAPAPRAAAGAPRHRLLAVAAAAHVSEADDRDGQRLVLRRRVHAAVSPATSRSPPTRRPSASPRSTGASRRGASSAARLAETVGTRDALFYIMTGRTFDGRKAAEMGLVNSSVPRARLRAEVEALARELLGKNPVVLRAAKLGFKHAQEMSWDAAEDYLYAKLEQSQFLDARARPRAGARPVPRREVDPAGSRALSARAVTLARLLADAAARFPDRPALISAGVTATFAELDDRAARAAGALVRRGVGGGDRVAFMLANTAESVAAFHGMLRLGAVPVPLNPLLSEHEIRGRVRESGATLLTRRRPRRRSFRRLGPTTGARRRRGHPVHLGLDRPAEADRVDPWRPPPQRRCDRKRPRTESARCAPRRARRSPTSSG